MIIYADNNDPSYTPEEVDMRVISVLSVKLFTLLFAAFFGTLALLILALISPAVRSSHRWLRLGSFSFQPSELAKLAVIIYIGHWLSSKGEQLRKLPYGLLPFTIMVGVRHFYPKLPFVLIAVVVTTLLAWLMGFNKAPERTFLVHGEPSRQIALANALEAEGHREVTMPERGDSFEL